MPDEEEPLEGGADEEEGGESPGHLGGREAGPEQGVPGESQLPALPPLGPDLEREEGRVGARQDDVRQRQEGQVEEVRVPKKRPPQEEQGHQPVGECRGQGHRGAEQEN